ncbi:hypothetical protein [Paenibacillus turpanensis]|uniref:hypothetical protein n=1 Tax=Paenibacillus turpanensis TaxID=2689078 RepID=UPI0014073272|nr:hypothetical protein [Paenibacillus turpanensis]
MILEAWQSLLSALQKEKSMMGIGTVGIVLAVHSCAGFLLEGIWYTSEVQWLQPLQFNLAMGIYSFTTAVFLTLTAWNSMTLRLFRFFYILSLLYLYIHENLLTLLGRNSPFSSGPFLTSELTNIPLYAAVAILTALCVLLAVRFFSRPSVHAQSYPTILGIRYGLLSTALGAVAVFIMSLFQNSGDSVGGVLFIHLFGFHGIHAVSFIGWAMARTPLPEEQKLAYVHTAGLAWFSGTVAVTVPSLQSLPFVFPTKWTWLSIAAILVWFTVFIRCLTHIRNAERSKAALPKSFSS